MNTKLIILAATIAIPAFFNMDAKKTPKKQPSAPAVVEAPVTAAPVRPVEQGTLVDIQTTMGPIKVLLYDDTPIHRDNFLKLANEGFYDGLLFHRVIKDFMVQTGDPKSRDAAPGEILGASDPGYTLEAEIKFPRHYNKYGALAAARTGDQVNPERRSSSSQFYIVTGNKFSEGQLQVLERRMNDTRLQSYFQGLVRENMQKIDSLQKAGDKEGLEALRQELIKQTEANVKPESMPEAMRADYMTVGGAPHLDGAYTVFGEVIEGMDTVEKIQQASTDSHDRPTEDIKIISMKVVGPGKH